jgi:hypothetical protein
MGEGVSLKIDGKERKEKVLATPRGFSFKIDRGNFSPSPGTPVND